MQPQGAAFCPACQMSAASYDGSSVAKQEQVMQQELVPYLVNFFKEYHMMDKESAAMDLMKDISAEGCNPHPLGAWGIISMPTLREAKATFEVWKLNGCPGLPAQRSPGWFVPPMPMNAKVTALHKFDGQEFTRTIPGGGDVYLDLCEGDIIEQHSEASWSTHDVQMSQQRIMLNGFMAFSCSVTKWSRS